MNRDQIRATCADRLAAWQEQLVEDHATPAFLIGLGHDHVEGQWCLCTTEDMTNGLIAAALRKIADMIDQGRTKET